MGTYKIIFAFISWEITGNDRCSLIELDFDCKSFSVVPEVPIGAVVSLVAMMAAIPVMKFRKRVKNK